MHNFEIFFERWVFDSDNADYRWVGSPAVLHDDMSDDEEEFYTKYQTQLNKAFDKDGHIKTRFKSVHPDVLVYIKAIENGDDVPESFKVGFYGATGPQIGKFIITTVIKKEHTKR